MERAEARPARGRVYLIRCSHMTQLILADGTTFEGESFGAAVDSDGEVVFTTGMTGYTESLTDPSYRGQILVFTYPLIGNYGVPSEEKNEWGFSKNFESEDIHVRAVVVAQASEHYSHHAAMSSFGNWLEHHGIPGITGIDTRMLTKKLREHGVMLGRMTQDKGQGIHSAGQTPDKGTIDDPNKRNLVAEVSCSDVVTYDPNPNPNPNPITVLAFDCGMKRNILRSFLRRGVRVIRVPWDFDIEAYDGGYDGVFVSNGPGDPKMCTATIKSIRRTIEKNVPTFGICLGNQLMALAIGGDTYKLPYGHRGVNQPCLEVCGLPETRNHVKWHVPPRGFTGQKPETSQLAVCEPGKQRCIITSQNHGFAVDEKLPADWSVWFRNANDGTVEGIRHDSGRFFAVQFHPEATPGPEDANYLFDDFIRLLHNSTESK